MEEYMKKPKPTNLDMFGSEQENSLSSHASETTKKPSCDEEKMRWKNDPQGSFARWARSENANGGKGFSAKSIVTYASMWGKFVKFCPSNPALADASIIERFVASLEGRVRNAKSGSVAHPDANAIRRRYLSMLDKLHEYLVREGVRTQNDVRSLLFEMDREIRALPRPMPVALMPEEEASLWAVVENWPCTKWRDCRDKALLALLIGSGIKVAETRMLQVSDLGLAAEAPYVRVSGGRNERLAPVTPTSLPILQAWLRQKGVVKPFENHVFPGDDQPFLSDSTIYRVVAKAIGKANLNPLHTGPSVLRHTFATRQLRAGKKLSDVSAWLGHEQETSTAIYKFMVVDPGGARPV
jgi:integrase/recombinase XerD